VHRSAADFSKASKVAGLCVGKRCGGGHVRFSVLVGAAVPGDTNSMLCGCRSVYYFFSISVK
jgi:hypothetical protein